MNERLGYKKRIISQNELLEDRRQNAEYQRYQQSQ